MSRVILFGAGASYGNGDVVPERPPLGNRLFDELVRCFPQSWGAMPTEVADAFRANFEQGMALVWERHSQATASLMQHMALYFVQFRPKTVGTTLYCRLVRAILDNGSEKDVLLSTLNYECLLDMSIWGAGLGICYGGEAAAGQLSLLKLHGACNFLPEGIGASRGVTFSRGVSFGTSIRPTGDLNEVVAFCLGNNALPPAMCLFMPGKPVQVSSAQIEQMQHEWREAVSTAERVAIVGVFPNGQDTHLWDCLGDTNAELLYVGGEEPFRDWCATNRPTLPSRFLSDRFDTAFDDLVELMA